MTNRLLPSVGYGNGGASTSQGDNTPQTWQGMATSEQGNTSSKYPLQPWTGSPSAYFPFSSESSLPYSQSRGYTSGATGQFGGNFDTTFQSKPQKCAGDVPLHHESSYYPDSFLHPRGESSRHLDPVMAVKDEPISPAPKSGGSNSTTSKCEV